MKTVHYETFAFDDDQQENLWASIQRASEIAGKDNLPKSLLLDMILVDFLATNDFGKSGDPANRTKYLRRIEQALGVRLVALDPDTRDVVFGAATLTWAAGE